MSHRYHTKVILHDVIASTCGVESFMLSYQFLQTYLHVCTCTGYMYMYMYMYVGVSVYS